MLTELTKLLVETNARANDALRRLNNPELYIYLTSQAIGIANTIKIVEEKIKKIKEYQQEVHNYNEQGYDYGNGRVTAADHIVNLLD